MINNKLKTLLVYISFGMLGCFSPEKNTSNNQAIEKEKEVWKKVAFCQCFRTLRADEIHTTNDGSLAGYIQSNEDLDIENIEIIATFVDNQIATLQEKYKSKNRANHLTLMKCFDLYDSKELDIVINQIVSK